MGKQVLSIWYLALGIELHFAATSDQVLKTKYRFLARHQLPGPDRCLDHGIPQGPAPAALFQFNQAFGRAAWRSSDRVFEQSWVMSGLKRQLGRTIQRLSGQS